MKIAENGVSIVEAVSKVLKLKNDPFKRLDCNICRRKFLSRRGLVQHIKSHFGYSLKSFILDTVPNIPPSFSKKIELFSGDQTAFLRYFKLRKSKKARSKADSASTEFSSDNSGGSSSMSDFTPTNGEIVVQKKPFTCLMCERMFRQKINLDKHMIFHYEYRL